MGEIYPMTRQVLGYGLMENGYKSCPKCNSINLHYMAMSLASSHYLDSSAPNNPNGYFENNNPPAPVPNTPLGIADYPPTAKTGFLGPFSPSGFPGYYSWYCNDCSAFFDSPSFRPATTIDNQTTVSPNTIPIESGAIAVVF